GSGWYPTHVSNEIESMADDDTRAMIEQLLAENAALRRQLPRDADTGLFSRGHFDERLSYEWRRAQASWTALALIHIDVSAWAPPSRVDGREPFTAPEMRRIALRLDDVCREIDVACRVGRTSIAIILPNTNRTGAEAECKRLADLLGDEALGFGMAVAFDEAQSPLELLMLASDAAERDRLESLIPEMDAVDEAFNDDPFDPGDGDPSLMRPTVSELPWIFEEAAIELDDDDDDDSVPTIPAARPSWVAA
ncbi:MAG: GGDEF domain-containing protein, partial [Polyangiaceae bacterium]